MEDDLEADGVSAAVAGVEAADLTFSLRPGLLDFEVCFGAPIRFRSRPQRPFTVSSSLKSESADADEAGRGSGSEIEFVLDGRRDMGD
jgi:hypothetical protein